MPNEANDEDLKGADIQDVQPLEPDLDDDDDDLDDDDLDDDDDAVGVIAPDLSTGSEDAAKGDDSIRSDLDDDDAATDLDDDAAEVEDTKPL
ncbi:MAG: adhesin [Myxococcota bacterium]|nr:adhesin [Myxococcota bacterium]